MSRRWTGFSESFSEGLDFSKERFEQLQKFDRLAWRSEVIGHEELFLDLHERLPKEMVYERELLICRK